MSGGGDPGLDTVGIGYDGSFLRAYLLANGDGSLNFSIGIDVNDTNAPQDSGELLSPEPDDSTRCWRCSRCCRAARRSVANNGTGFPDYTLSGFNIDLGTDIHAGDQLIFYARISGANDGPDSFFRPVLSPARSWVRAFLDWLLHCLVWSASATIGDDVIT